jgi:hypothetical protein
MYDVAWDLDVRFGRGRVYAESRSIDRDDAGNYYYEHMHNIPFGMAARPKQPFRHGYHTSSPSPAVCHWMKGRL